MQLFFRELNLNDLPAVFDICKNIWKDENDISEDYLPKIIKSWILEEKRFTFGAFIDAEKSHLIALGSVKYISEEYAWMEGGRVAEEYQRKGIGKILTQYCINYAKNMKYKYIQYDTFTQNSGSVGLAKSLGYYQKDYMELLEGELSKISLDNFKSSPFIEVSPEEAFEFLEEIPNGPVTEISAGWSYKPFNLQQVSKIEGTWIRNDAALILKIGSEASLEGENPLTDEIWFIIYGNVSKATILLQKVLIQERNRKQDFNKLSIRVFCPKALSQPIQKLGFSYVEGKPSGVVLFEKKL
ncbi:GNAT family N-acetyltransferase [Promethearchaeum syntrophicum]|uniref:GNAT family N-acetyltransferase n=1 Tax=Promethearchaeum syntrophicum TaxID=2594042 RepID=A0A5B9DE01_9ARCH|nr:GNAT family N-acetyltransferase [Candidatus Prometheoarchaeum syntrophicum]QEE17221.1 Acetyltransferase (GNAT) family protein [Candidatus Prometheoarchaeum syntrophicum]